MKKVPFAAMILSACVSAFAGDQWTSAGKDQMYPQALYVVGVGMSERSQDAAKQNAVVEVKKQLSVSVNASMLDEQMSMIAVGKETAANRVESRSRLSTSGAVEGIEVVKTAKQGNLYYALAALDKKNFESNVRTRIAELKKELVTLIDGAKADIASAAISPALIKLSSAKKVIAQVLEQRKFLSAVAEVTEAEALPYSQTDIALLYDKCVSTLRLVKVSGDAQSFAVGMVPAEPFVVSLAVQGAAAPGIPVNLLDDKKKSVLTAWSDDAGKAEFSLSELADVSAGKHSYVASIALNVSADLKKQLTAQNQTFSYTVTSNPCYAKISVDVDAALAAGKDDITKKILARLSKYDLKDDPSASMTLSVAVSAKETGNVTGLSENTSFVKTDVSLTLTLKDEDGKELGSISATAKGTGGSLVKSTSQGVETAKIEKDLKTLLDKMCTAAPDGPRLRIAVFDFKERGAYASWYETAQKLSDMLITRLINSGKVDVVERTQLQKIMDEKSLAQSGVVEEKEALQIAQLAGADIILVGSASIAGDKIEADIRVVDMKNGIAKCAANSSSYSINELRAMADELVGKVKGSCLK